MSSRPDSAIGASTKVSTLLSPGGMNRHDGPRSSSLSPVDERPDEVPQPSCWDSGHGSRSERTGRDSWFGVHSPALRRRAGTVSRLLEAPVFSCVSSVPARWARSPWDHAGNLTSESSVVFGIGGVSQCSLQNSPGSRCPRTTRRRSRSLAPSIDATTADRIGSRLASSSFEVRLSLTKLTRKVTASAACSSCSSSNAREQAFVADSLVIVPPGSVSP